MTTKIAKLQNTFLKDQKFDALTLANPIDLFYLLGINLSSGRLLLTKENFLLGVDGRYFDECYKIFKENVVLLERGDMRPLFEKAQISTFAFDSQVETFGNIEAISQFATPFPIKAPTASLRSLKEEYERERLQQAGVLAERGYEYIVKKIRKGVTELQLARQLQAFWFENGGDGASFEPIIAFGERSQLPHARPTDRELKQDEIVLIDIGVEFASYQSDMTRVVFFGQVPHILQKAFDHTETAHKKSLEVTFSGCKACDIDKAARAYIDSTEFKGCFNHSTGHGIGLEVHEAPFLRATSEDVLQERMFVTIEPGIYISGVGGIRLENTYEITEHGPKSLQKTPFITKINP